MRSLQLFVVSSLFCLACSPAPDSPAPYERRDCPPGFKCDSGIDQPLYAPEWTRCWIEKGDSDLFFRVDQLFCNQISNTNTIVLYPVSINVFTANNVHGASLDGEAEGPVRVAGLRDNDYPIRINLDFHPRNLTMESPIKGLSSLGGMDAVIEVEGPDSYTKDAPFVINQPFDLWPIRVITKNTHVFVGSLHSYVLSLDPLIRDYDESSSYEIGYLNFIYRARDEIITTYLPVNRDTVSLTGKMTTSEVQDAPIEVAGPGWYITEGENFRKATAEEIEEANNRCTEGETRCQDSSDTIEVCTQGSWASGEDCAQNGQVCVEGECQEQGVECTQGATRCAAGSEVVEICLDGAWTADTDCAESEQVCVAGQCSQPGDCQAGDSRCRPDSQVVESCQDGVWVLVADCAESGLVCELGQCRCPDNQAYLTWLASFADQIRASGSAIDENQRDGLEALLESIECDRADLAAYTPWFELFEERLATFSDGPYNNFTADEAELLEFVLRAAPESADDASYQHWHATFAARLGQYYQPNNAYSNLTDTERNLIDLLNRARPLATGDDAYQTWHQHFASLHGQFFQPNNVYSVINEPEAEVLELVVAVRPAAVSDSAYRVWHEHFTGLIDQLHQPTNPYAALSDNEKAALEMVLTARPPATGDEAYLAWWEHFRARLEGCGQSISDPEAVLLEMLLEAKTCVLEEGQALETWNLYREQNTNSQYESYLDLADPLSCD